MIRPRWSGWYRTPNRWRTTAATRAQVHKAVLKPATRGPESSSLNSCHFCFSESLACRGGCGLRTVILFTRVKIRSYEIGLYFRDGAECETSS